MKKSILLSIILFISIISYSQIIEELVAWEYGPTEAIAVKDSTAYISSGSYLWVLDISDESNPTLIDEMYLENNIQFIRRLGNYLYVSKNDSVLNIYSIHQADNPIVAGNITFSYGLIVGDISFYEDTVFLTRLGQSGCEYYLNDSIDLQIIRFIDVNTTFKQIGNVGIGIGGGGVKTYDMTQIGNIFAYNDILNYAEEIRGFTMNGSYIYVGIGSKGIGIVDASDINNLVNKGNIGTGGITYDVELIEDTILIAGKGTKGIGIYDIENDTILTQIGECDTDGFVYELEVIGDRLYVGARSGGLIIIDISDKSDPTIIGSYDGYSECRGIDIRNNRLYAAGADGGISIYDISVANSINFISKSYTRYISEDVSVDDSFAYVAEGDSGLTIVDISDEMNPHVVGYVDIPYFARQVDNYQDVCVVGGNRINDSEGIIITDVSDRTNPIIKDTVMSGKEMVCFTIYENYLHCIGYYWDRHYEIWNINNPDSIILMDSIREHEIDFIYIVVDSGLSFLSVNSKDTVKCYDVSNPDSIIKLSHINSESFGYTMSYNNGYLYELIYRDWDIYVYDYSNVTNPVETDIYNLGYYSEEMKHNGNYMYMSIGGGAKGSNLERGRYGLKVFRTNPSGISDNSKQINEDIRITSTFNTITIENKTNTTKTYQITDITGRVVDKIDIQAGITEYKPNKSGIYFVVTGMNQIVSKAIIIK